MYVEQQRGMGQEPVSTAIVVAPLVAKLVSGFFGPNLAKVRDTQRVEEFNQMYLVPISQMNQDDIAVIRSEGLCSPRGIPPDRLESLAAELEAGMASTGQSFERSASKSNQAFTIGSKTVAGLRRRAQKRREKCGNGILAPVARVTGMDATTLMLIGGGLLAWRFFL
ncbi:MAG: hypothetical protein V3U28_06695 [Candidatus Acidoferrales bacterium]